MIISLEEYFNVTNKKYERKVYGYTDGTYYDIFKTPKLYDYVNDKYLSQESIYQPLVIKISSICRLIFDLIFENKINERFVARTSSLTREEKMYLLKCIRDAICHNHITFTLSPVKRGDDFNFEDVKLAFTADWNRTVISGRVADFFKLFGSENFMKERSNEIVNGKVHVVVSDEDMGNFDEETLSSNTKNNQSKVDDQSNNSNGQPGDE